MTAMERSKLEAANEMIKNGGSIVENDDCEGELENEADGEECEEEDEEEGEEEQEPPEPTLAEALGIKE